MDRFVVISGCSGGGKSTLLTELEGRGYCVVEEPGRRIVRAETQSNGTALPWIDLSAFLRRAIEMAIADRTSVQSSEDWVFFDRGLIDAAVGLEEVTGEPILATLGHTYRYHSRVFLAPPWPEIYVQDPERRHGMNSAMAEYSRLLNAYPSIGYDVSILPKVGVVERADFVLTMLGACRSD
ncbi:AAA family ATPase [Paraburkholderia silvatlantica]|uniref:ATPase n=1 Tax=Paraburkholderia silvatlantica TaxID=321895 RepID=A0ABR6FR29_9BURK|nr:AAA family ATPase [Paraburkholderia silvatlantica]MBB2929885.1 putative ATPase [Paraburkholderia silvatlantica]PVY29570.1 putative ATPase [Paraburkholderia silvatlantica]PXW25266.1 putative ATPase [Paraburkholderia silvatlantica]